MRTFVAVAEASRFAEMISAQITEIPNFQEIPISHTKGVKPLNLIDKLSMLHAR